MGPYEYELRGPSEIWAHEIDYEPVRATNIIMVVFSIFNKTLLLILYFLRKKREQSGLKKCLYDVVVVVVITSTHHTTINQPPLVDPAACAQRTAGRGQQCVQILALDHIIQILNSYVYSFGAQRSDSLAEISRHEPLQQGLLSSRPLAYAPLE